MGDSVCSLVISRAVLLAYRDTNLERKCYRNPNTSKLCSPYEIGVKDVECATHELGEEAGLHRQANWEQVCASSSEPHG